MLALFFLVLAGMGALAVDLGRAYNLETQLQKGADAAALACASELDGTTQSAQQAKDAALGFPFFADRALARNKQSFANDGDPNVIDPNFTVVEFYAVPGGPALDVTIPAIAATARFCRVPDSAESRCRPTPSIFCLPA